MKYQEDPFSPVFKALFQLMVSVSGKDLPLQSSTP